MKSKYIQILFICALLIPLNLQASDEKSENTASSVSSKNTAIHHLIEQGWKYQLIENNTGAADSILEKAIRMSEMTYENDLMLVSYNAYLECMDIGNYNKKRMALVPKLERIIPQQNNLSEVSRSFCNISSVYLSVYNFDKALEYAYKAFSAAEQTSNTGLKAKSYISIGKAMEGKNQLLEAFRNYLQAMNLAEKQKDISIQIESHKALSRFYNLNKDYDNAIKHKLIQNKLIQQQKTVDTTALMWIQFELEEINYNSMKTVNESNMDSLLQFSDTHHKYKLRDFTLTLYRSYLIYSERLDKLKRLYFEKYPVEFEKLKSSDAAMYHRILALFSEKEGKISEAFQHWNESEKLLQGESNKIFKANFYIRFGQFLMRQEKISEAINKFENAWKLSNEASYLIYALDATEELEKAFITLNDYKNAYKFTRLHLELHDSLSSITKKDDLLRLEIDNTTRQREEFIQREQQETERRHSLQYIAITIIMGIVFIILLILGSISVPKWTIEMLGFISFILLFEFIILIADQKIHHFTHGEPWKILIIKIVLIGIMMPLHQYTEKKVIHYLVHKKVVTFKGFSIRRFFKELFSHDEIQN